MPTDCWEIVKWQGLTESILLRPFDSGDAISGIQDLAAGVTFGGAW
jgi:hypothetical protein